MTLLVTAVAFFAAVEFSSTMMPRETRASGREKKGGDGMAVIFGVKFGEARREEEASAVKGSIP
jgi:hypothetical protein